MTSVRFRLLALLVAALTIIGPTAAGQTEVPEQAEPAVELLSPTLYRGCGVAILALILGPVLVPVDPATATTPADDALACET